MDKIKEKMMKVEDISKLKECLMDGAKAELTKGLEMVNTKEMGEVVDMIKDLAEAEEKCMKACYYAAICKAMCEEKEEMERMGYNANRYASGRYAPKGHGNYTRMGHHMPYEMMGEDDAMTEYEEMLMNRGRMGYGGQGGGSSSSSYGGQGSSSSGSDRGGQGGGSSRSGYGESYDRYREARRHYTETKSSADKSEMDSYAGRHLGETIATMKEIWKDADPTLRAQMKKDMTSLISEMN